MTEDTAAMQLDEQDWYTADELSEDFYGLIGGGISALFDNFPGVFEQVCRIAGVELSDLLPIYVSRTVLDGEELDDEVAAIKKDLRLAQQRFRALHDNLVAQPGWEAELVFPESGYNPEREYFADFASDQFHKPRTEFEDWEEERFYAAENLKSSFGRDVRYVLRFIELAIETGNQSLWFEGR